MKYMTAIPRGSRHPWSPFMLLVLVAGLTVTACAPSGAGASAAPASLAGRYRVSGGGGPHPGVTPPTHPFTQPPPRGLWGIEKRGPDAAIAAGESAGGGPRGGGRRRTG